MDYDLRELSFGETIGKSINLYLDNFLPIFTLSLIAAAPSTIFNLLQPNFQAGDVTNIAGQGMVNILTWLINFVTVTIIQGVTIDFVSRRYLGHDTYLPDAFKDAPNYIGKLIGLSIATTIIIVLPILIAIIPILGAIVALIAIGVLVVSLSFAPHIVVIEKTGIIGALDRSWYLAGKNRFKIFGLLLITGLITLLLTAALMAVLGMSFTDMEILLVQLGSDTFLVGSAIIRALTAPIAGCAMILMYFNLRIQKEGFDIELLSRRFSDTNDE